ncbi:unnamed protein product [marine sediment metagenome]|uniref:Uncharacterized protein n=1 Tax=marine sediment metagenome TaxID=412755 RepID=X1B0H7_9ZZZZ
MGRAEEAGLRMELGPEAERLVFPPTPAPYSIPQITSKAMMQSIVDFAEAAPTTAKFWTRRGKEPKTQQGLIGQYVEWRALAGYDYMNPVRQNQLDQQWDAYVAGDEKFDKWWLNKKKRQPIAEIKALRTPGKIGKMMRKRITDTGGITPLGRSVAKDKPRSVIPMDPSLFGVHAARGIVSAMKPAPPVSEQQPIRQRNRRTGQERISYDGGKTWSMQ